MANVVDDLERLGLAERRPHPAHRRAHEVRLTDKASSELPGMVESVQQADRELTAQLSEAELTSLRYLLRQIAQPLAWQ
jgi:DNA-binding MarR family transcriptional regulator